MATKTPNPQGTRIMDLCEKIVTIYSKDDIKRLASIDPYTLDRCAQRKHVLRTGNAMGLADILAVRNQTLRDYYDQKITLDELWEKRGEAPRVNVYGQINFDDILYHAKNLEATKRLEIAKKLLETLKIEEQPTESFIELSEQSKKRLKTLLRESLKYSKKTTKDLIESGVSGAALADILEGFKRDYTSEVYESLVPYLYSILEWIDDETLIVAYPNKLSSIDELLKELKHT